MYEGNDGGFRNSWIHGSLTLSRPLPFSILSTAFSCVGIILWQVLPMLLSEMATNSYRLTSSDARECPREESDLLSLGDMPTTLKGKGMC